MNEHIKRYFREMPRGKKMIADLDAELLTLEFPSAADLDRFRSAVEAKLGPYLEVPRGKSLQQLVGETYREHGYMKPSPVDQQRMEERRKELEQFTQLEEKIKAATLQRAILDGQRAL